MDDLIAFLRARLDEDEAAARRAAKKRRAPWRISGRRRVISAAGNPDIVVADTEGLAGEIAEHITRHDPARVLREVAAMRTITDRYAEPLEGWGLGEQLQLSQEKQGLYFAVLALAAAWSDHSDFRQEWVAAACG